MGADGLDGATDGLVGVLKTFKPVAEVNAAFANGGERLVGDATSKHLVVEMVIAHVAGSTMRVRHNHDVGNAQFVDGDDKAAHGRVKR